ncbi:hypothetical protein SAMN02745166_04300 [Prosthecobacter debontii]|uniref:Uncharacterized protein n=1 Tax=Prosthecobacter debontii TaxID=48467 RepID=A0A1T4YUW4_9BACT|nr:hypothetical protein [Prosthecobacter debontii]SKB05540.1 hypothetical protein SAMN02745166_04300 [Prosthecobacter debontii]
MVHTGAKIFGNRLFWGQLKSAFHGGSRRLRSWHWIPDEEIEHEGCTYRAFPGYAFGVTSTAIVHRFRPPTRYKARHLDSLKLICNATGFIQAVQRGIQQGLI